VFPQYLNWHVPVTWIYLCMNDLSGECSQLCPLHLKADSHGEYSRIVWADSTYRSDEHMT
jgi:hypothetical protein